MAYLDHVKLRIRCLLHLLSCFFCHIAHPSQRSSGGRGTKLKKRLSYCGKRQCPATGAAQIFLNGFSSCLISFANQYTLDGKHRLKKVTQIFLSNVATYSDGIAVFAASFGFFFDLRNGQNIWFQRLCTRKYAELKPM